MTLQDLPGSEDDLGMEDAWVTKWFWYDMHAIYNSVCVRVCVLLFLLVTSIFWYFLTSE